MLLQCKESVPTIPDAIDIFKAAQTIKVYSGIIVPKIQIFNETFGTCEHENCHGNEEHRLIFDYDETIESFTYGRSEDEQGFTHRLVRALLGAS